MICPWCVADGRAGKQGASFNCVDGLIESGVSQEVVEEVELRTPGIVSWQDLLWVGCCSDACAYYGDVPENEIKGLDEAGVQKLADETGFPIGHLRDYVSWYQPGGSPAFYKFVCRHCGAVRYRGDAG